MATGTKNSRLVTVLSGSAPDAARRLLGCELRRTLPDGTIMRGRIVETEAYDEQDPSSHTFRGQTPRNSVMYGPAGHLYVYFIYGMYYCCNIVTGPEGYGEAVLIRAIEPIEGEEFMRENRRDIGGKNLTNGPGKLCIALGITKDLNGHDLTQLPLELILKPEIKTGIAQKTRIGLRFEDITEWRFYLESSEYVSKR